MSKTYIYETTEKSGGVSSLSFISISKTPLPKNQEGHRDPDTGIWIKERENYPLTRERAIHWLRCYEKDLEESSSTDIREYCMMCIHTIKTKFGIE